MKQKDIALIAIVVFFSAIFSYFISNAIFASPDKRQQQVEVVRAITTEFPKPDERFFNDQAFDSTRIIVIGDDTNTDPFSNKKQ